jgi:cyclophilin family peptidyl-prolyl cis-trans isomerase
MTIKDFIQNNPYRVMGAFTNDSFDILSTNFSRMKAFAAIGKTVVFEHDMERVAGPKPDRQPEALATSMASLSSPEGRLLHPHKRGALAAAREGDKKNPERRSGASQFYIVWGKIYDDRRLDYTQTKLDSITNGEVKLTPEMREVYKTIGGTPHLDGQYTVFGEIVEGLDVVEAIQGVAVDKNDRPLEDIRIIKATVTKDFPAPPAAPKKAAPKRKPLRRR